MGKTCWSSWFTGVRSSFHERLGGSCRTSYWTHGPVCLLRETSRSAHPGWFPPHAPANPQTRTTNCTFILFLSPSPLPTPLQSLKFFTPNLPVCLHPGLECFCTEGKINRRCGPQTSSHLRSEAVFRPLRDERWQAAVTLQMFTCTSSVVHPWGVDVSLAGFEEWSLCEWGLQHLHSCSASLSPRCLIISQHVGNRSYLGPPKKTPKNHHQPLTLNYQETGF